MDCSYDPLFVVMVLAVVWGIGVAVGLIVGMNNALR